MAESPLKRLLAACRHGDLGAQRILYDQHSKNLFAVCLRYARDRHEAQDILQETFLVVYRDLQQYRFEGAFEGWLQRVAVRTALQYLRRRNPLRFADDYTELPADTWNVEPDTELKTEAILGMVQQLPAGYRTVFNLHCVEAWSYAEIAGSLGIAESTVRSQYARACKQLREMVEHFLVI